MDENIRKIFFKVFKWPKMCPLGKILAHNFEVAVTKILRQRDKTIAPLLSTGSRETLQTQHVMDDSDCNAAIAKAAAAVTYIQNLESGGWFWG